MGTTRRTLGNTGVAGRARDFVANFPSQRQMERKGVLLRSQSEKALRAFRRFVSGDGWEGIPSESRVGHRPGSGKLVVRPLAETTMMAEALERPPQASAKILHDLGGRIFDGAVYGLTH